METSVFLPKYMTFAVLWNRVFRTTHGQADLLEGRKSGPFPPGGALTWRNCAWGLPRNLQGQKSRGDEKDSME